MPKEKKNVLDRMKERLQGSKFRVLNESLYTQDSHAAYRQFQSTPSLFQEYHAGFRHQCSQWPLHPLDIIIASLRKRIRKNKYRVIADLGCGEARLAQTLQSEFRALRIHSLDLVSPPHLSHLITACNITDTKLDSNSIDAAVVCLALMNTDMWSIINECHRILRIKGILYIAEVESRFPNNDVRGFRELVEGRGGFRLVDERREKMFVMWQFEKNQEENCIDASMPALNACIYKRR
jgi:ribosomal RNA-processing protein 8